MFVLSRTMYIFEANLNLLADTSTPNLERYHLGQSLTASCLRCWSTGPTEREIQLWSCTPTNTRRAKSAMIALTGGLHLQRL